MNIRNFTYTALLAMMMPAAAILSSCDALYDDLDPCPQGVRLRFVYDYNMEYANAFPSQVDCLTLLVYDEEGKYIRTETAGKELTSDEYWRMTVDLPAGNYHLLAYGGLDCREASFKFTSDPDKTPLENIEVILPPYLITNPKGYDLHPLFYGALDVTVPESGTTYTEETVYMMKDTNDIRVLLANESGEPTYAEDFVFSITDNNTRFNYLNDIISTQNVTYSPWVTGNSEAGILPDEQPATVCWAEFSVSRLMEGSDARLTVTRAKDGKKVLSIPLVNVLELLKSEHYSKMDSQEFLDRQSRWNLTFILNGQGVWAGVSIVINDWVVRINNISGL